MTRSDRSAGPAPRNGLPASAPADAGPMDTYADALAAARQLLAETAEAINPGTPAAELLACLQRYRAHLATLVAASQPGPPSPQR